jgi:hypothetical protein
MSERESSVLIALGRYLLLAPHQRQEYRAGKINCATGYVTGQSKQRLSHRLKRPHVRYDEVRQKFIDPIVLERPAKARAGEYVDLVEREYDFFRAVASQTNARFPLPNLNTPFLKIGCIYTRAAS